MAFFVEVMSSKIDACKVTQLQRKIKGSCMFTFLSTPQSTALDGHGVLTPVNV